MVAKSQPRAPLALAAVLFAGGIWLSQHWHVSSAMWGQSAALLAICAVIAVTIKNLRLAQTSATLALLCAGAFTRIASPVPHIVVPPAEFLDGGKIEIIAHVTNDGALLAGGGPRERFDVQTEVLQFNDTKFTQPVGIRVTVFSGNADEESNGEDLPDLPKLTYGDRLHLTAKLRLPRNFRNPGSFDYEGYLRGVGINVLASAKAKEVEILPGSSGSRLGFWRSRIRRSILEHIHHKSLWGREDAALFAAMIVGDDSLLLRNVREEFQQTGVYHLLVVSGMNVGLLAFAVFWIARRLQLPHWAASLGTIALSVFYAYIAGMGVAIIRAVLMLSLFLIARLFYRNRSGLNATGFAALAVLVISPSALFDAGFQLTFLALLAITGISLPILERTSAPYRQALRPLDTAGIDLAIDARLAQFRLDLRLIAGRIARFIGVRPARWFVTGIAGSTLALYELAIVSAITQAALVLPMRSYFHRAAIIGLPANILVLPLAGTMLNSGVAAIALSYVSPSLARVAAVIASASLHWTLGSLHWLSRLSMAQWRVPDANPLLIVLALSAIVMAFFAVRRQGRIAFAGIALLLVLSCAVAFYHADPKTAAGKLEITAIDVGQGDSLLVISPEGRTMLIDGGGSIGPVHSEFDFGEDVVAPYLWTRGIQKLDVVALTHAHGDHIGGLGRIIQNFHPTELWVGINPETPLLKQLFSIANENQAAICKHTAGETFNWSGTKIRVLSPPPDWQPKVEPKNDDSLALLITFGNTGALLAGDLEKKMEKFVATESPHADVLKIAHHGSATSTTPELLAAVKPRFAVISAGYHNAFGHPRPVVLERLQAEHVQTYRTDMLGVVTFLLDGKSVQAVVGTH